MCDQIGSLRIVANSFGTVVKRIEYDTFGNILTDSDPLFEIPFGFAGGLHDRDTGLVRFGFRDYDSDTGRWTAKDPIGFAGGDTDLFGYCMSDPVNFIDPFGLDEIHVGNGKVTYKNENGKVEWSVPANSGRDKGLNNPDMQKMPGTGPTPEGTYYIDLSNNAEPDKTSANGYGWGQYGWRLKESFFTKIKRKACSDRDGGFYLHQDEYSGNPTGTAGCVGVTGDENIKKVKDSLEKYSKNKKEIKVIVNYEK